MAYVSFRPVLIRCERRSLTPPVDEDEKNDESRRLEAHARKELEGAGCPPCYPPDIDITTRKVPPELQAIVDYWLTSLRTDDVVLCAQASDHRKFLTDQLHTRRRLGNKYFGKFEDEVRERRRRYGLRGDVQLLPNPKQQSRLQNWVEFQDYHLKKLERLEMEQDETRQKLDNVRKLASDRRVLATERAGEDIEALEQILDRVERSIEQHKVLLDWIEQRRQAMGSGHPTPPREENTTKHAVLPEIGLRSAARSGRRWGSKASSTSMVLGRAKVMKAQPMKRKMPIQKPRHPEVRPTVQNLNAIPQAAPIHEKTARRLTKEDEPLLRPLRPQRGSKATRFANGGAKPFSRTQRRRTGHLPSPDRTRSKRQLAPQRPQPAPQTVTTRTRRISRPPARWVPG